MATKRIPIRPLAFELDTINPAASAEFGSVIGRYLAGNPVGPEYLYYPFRYDVAAVGDWTLSVPWSTDTATAGQVVYAADFAIWTPNTSLVDLTSLSYGTETTVSDDHLGTTPQRPHEISMVIASSVFAAASVNDQILMRFHRKTTAEVGGISGFVVLSQVLELSYSDS